jgi:hypothetical protein
MYGYIAARNAGLVLKQARTVTGPIIVDHYLLTPKGVEILLDYKTEIKHVEAIYATSP